jgi:hypothetical protein
MTDANQPALENRKNTFNPICCHVASHELASTMIDTVMIETRFAKARMSASFIGMQGRSDFDMLPDRGLYRV